MEGSEQGSIMAQCVEFLEMYWVVEKPYNNLTGKAGTSILERPFGHSLTGFTTVGPTTQKAEPGILY